MSSWYNCAFKVTIVIFFCPTDVIFLSILSSSSSESSQLDTRASVFTRVLYVKLVRFPSPSLSFFILATVHTFLDVPPAPSQTEDTMVLNAVESDSPSFIYYINININIIYLLVSTSNSQLIKSFLLNSPKLKDLLL